MSVYTYKLHDINNNNETNLYLSERNIYGSSRIGMEQVGQIIASTDSLLIKINEENGIYNGITNQFNQQIGDKRYELSNHIGNVLEVITDRKVAIDFTNYDPNTGTYTSTLADGSLDYYTADVISQNDYFPYGMLLPNRHEAGNEYRYGYQGSEKDDEVKGEGNSYTTHFRQLDPRVGRWLSIDPKATAWESPYVSMGDNPVSRNDVLGDKWKNKADKDKATSINKKLDIRKKEFSKDVSKYNEKIKKFTDKGKLDKVQKFENLKNKAQEGVDEMQKAQEGVDEMQKAQDELLEIEKSETEFTFEHKDGQLGGTKMDKNGTVVIGYTTEYNAVHELVHAYQYISGELDMKPGGYMAYYDLTDEVKAYRRQYIYSGAIIFSKTVQSEYPISIKNSKDINAQFVLKIYIVIGVEIGIENRFYPYNTEYLRNNYLPKNKPVSSK